MWNITRFPIGISKVSRRNFFDSRLGLFHSVIFLSGGGVRCKMIKTLCQSFDIRDHRLNEIVATGDKTKVQSTSRCAWFHVNADTNFTDPWWTRFLLQAFEPHDEDEAGVRDSLLMTRMSAPFSSFSLRLSFFSSCIFSISSLYCANFFSRSSFSLRTLSYFDL